MIIISLLHLSLFLGVSSRRHIFTASFSFVTCKTESKKYRPAGHKSLEKQRRSIRKFGPFGRNVIRIQNGMTPHSHGVGRSKHGRSHPCQASLWTPIPRSSGSAWREVSPLSSRNLRASTATTGHKQGEADECYHDKLPVPSEKTALIHIRIGLVPGCVTRFLSDYAVSVTTSTS